MGKMKVVKKNKVSVDSQLKYHSDRIGALESYSSQVTAKHNATVVDLDITKANSNERMNKIMEQFAYIEKEKASKKDLDVTFHQFNSTKDKVDLASKRIERLGELTDGLVGAAAFAVVYYTFGLVVPAIIAFGMGALLSRVYLYRD